MEDDQVTPTTAEQELAEVSQARGALAGLLNTLGPELIALQGGEDSKEKWNYWPYLAAALMFTGVALGALALVGQEYSSFFGAFHGVPRIVAVTLAVLFIIVSIPLATRERSPQHANNTEAMDALDAAALAFERKDPDGFLYRFITFIPEGSEEATELCKFADVSRLEQGWGRDYIRAAYQLYLHLDAKKKRLREAVVREYASRNGIPKPSGPTGDPVPTS